MQFRIRVSLVLGLLIAACHSPAKAQINAGYFRDYGTVPVVEPYFDTGCFTTGCYQDPEPCWLGQASFDVLLFDRSDADPRTIVATPSTSIDFGPPIGEVTFPGDPLLNTSDLGFPITAGFRFNLVLTGDDGCDFVFNYLGAKFDNSRVYAAPAATFNYFEFDDIVPAASPSFQTSYMSTLTSVEFNARSRQWSRFAPSVGLRFIQLSDQFDRLSADGSTDIVLSKTDNGLWGFQFGGEALLWDGGAVRLQSNMKSGVFYNALKLSTGGGQNASSGFDPTASFLSDHISYFGELNLELAYQVCPQVSIRVGYTAMWLDGVALAPDQHDNFNLQAGTGDFDLGTVMFYGSYVGAEVTW